MQRLVAITIALLLLAGAAWWKLTSGPGTYRYVADNAVYHQFSGDLALEHVTKLVAFGPRPAGSDPLEASRNYIEQQLIALGWATQRQMFEDQTPNGPVQFVNLRARYLGSGAPSAVWERQPPVLIGSHYDTKPYSDFTFVGANDGGSSTGALIELARVTASQPSLAQSLELVFFDGEEAFDPNITPTDGLYGSRFYGKQLRRLPPEERPKFGLILDMIGDKSLNVGVPNDSPFKLFQALMNAAKDLGYEKHFGQHTSAILDDHVPLNQSGVPTIDIIDLDYGVWHTADDTLEHVSAESLRIVGSTTLLLLEKYILGKLVPAA